MLLPFNLQSFDLSLILGFLVFKSSQEAQCAVDEMNGIYLANTHLVVSFYECK